MTKSFWRKWGLLLVIPGLVLVASCAKKQVKPSEEEIAAAHQMTDQERQEQAARFAQKTAEDERMSEERLREEAKMRRERDMFTNEDIHFEFDKSQLLPDAQEILKRKAAWLMAHPEVSAVTIEGHCDERGSNEYNIALGDRRAQSAKAFLVNLGVKSDRLSTVSYGEERPLDPGHNEAAWAKNRRAHFTFE
jgi:peptidoglycan-associated lipoprotein